jgi:hypothetical protein
MNALLLLLLAASRPGDVLIADVPHVLQKPDFCGEACVEMYLHKLGSPIDQDAVFAEGGVDPALGRGLFTPELKRALERIGFRPGAVWYAVSADDPSPGLARLWEEMHRDLLAGVPSIVCTRFDDSAHSTEHFRLVLGFDADKSEVIYHDPAIPGGAYLRMSLERFLGLWPLKYDESRWTVIRFRLDPGRIMDPRRSKERFSPADYAQHVMQLKTRLPGDFSIVLEPPFVVVGDETKPQLTSHAESTVRWAVRLLKQDFFKDDPRSILDIWLLKNAESYEKTTRELMREAPDTPFGYYSAKHNALIMNISTGGGTLVHEIVHPFIEANVPDCPTWFNEGLGSLYEQSGEENGHIHGYTNWRLAGLKNAIRRGVVPSFEKMMLASAHQFYDLDPGTNYAEARYLLYYLQQRDLLLRFYRELLVHRDDDPSGVATLKRVLEEDDLAGAKLLWEKFVLGLEYK